MILLVTIIGIITPVWKSGKIISNNEIIEAANEVQPRAVSVTYKDWADYSRLESRYSYSTLFWTDRTEVENIDCEMVIGDYYYGTEGKDFQIKITNCAIDMDGDLCDVIISINNIKNFKSQDAN